MNWGRDEDRRLWEFDLGRTLRSGLIGLMFGPLVSEVSSLTRVSSTVPPSLSQVILGGTLGMIAELFLQCFAPGNTSSITTKKLVASVALFALDVSPSPARVVKDLELFGLAVGEDA